MREYVKLSPEFHSGDVAHAPQQGSFAQPPRNVGPQLRFRLWRQAAVNERQAVGGAESQCGYVQAASEGNEEFLEANGERMEKADDH